MFVYVGESYVKGFLLVYWTPVDRLLLFVFHENFEVLIKLLSYFGWFQKKLIFFTTKLSILWI